MASVFGVGQVRTKIGLSVTHQQKHYPGIHFGTRRANYGSMAHNVAHQVQAPPPPPPRVGSLVVVPCQYTPQAPWATTENGSWHSHYRLGI